MTTAWGHLRQKLSNMADAKEIPLSGVFELTPRCNLKCNMCYIIRPAKDRAALNRELSAKEWIMLAEAARDAGMLFLLYTGGEVFLRKDFKEIYEEVCRMGFVVEIYTNATLITPEIAKWLGRIAPFKVGVTLYGASGDTYARVCKDADAFEQAVRGIDLLLAEGINLHLKTTVVKENVNDFDEIACFAEERGLLLRIVEYIIPGHRESIASTEEVRLSADESVDYRQYADNYFNQKRRTENKTDRTQLQNHFEEDMHVDNNRKEKYLNGEDPFFCSAGKSAFWITWDGRMIPCATMEESVTFPMKDGFALAWNNLLNKCKSIPVAHECLKCSLKNYCLTCPARLKSETGFYNQPAPYLCRRASREKQHRNIDN